MILYPRPSKPPSLFEASYAGRVTHVLALTSSPYIVRTDRQAINRHNIISYHHTTAPHLFFFISPIHILIAFELSCVALNTVPTHQRPNPRSLPKSSQREHQHCLSISSNPLRNSAPSPEPSAPRGLLAWSAISAARFLKVYPPSVPVPHTAHTPPASLAPTRRKPNSPPQPHSQPPPPPQTTPTTPTPSPQLHTSTRPRPPIAADPQS